MSLFRLFVVVLIERKGNFLVIIQALNSFIAWYHLITLFLIQYVLSVNHLMGTEISEFLIVHQILLIKLSLFHYSLLLYGIISK